MSANVDQQSIQHDSLAGFPRPSRQHTEGDPAWVMRVKLSVAFGVCAVGGLFVSLTRDWWEIHYDRHQLCEQNQEYCSLHVQMGLTMFCFGTPAHFQCDNVDHIEQRFSRILQIRHLASVAHFVLVLAMLVHIPLLAVLLVLLGLKRCRSSGQARHCGLRTATCLALLAAGLGAAVIIIFIGVMLPRYMEFTWHLVGQAFGRMAMGNTKLQDRVHLSPVACTVAIAFDISVSCLTFHGHLFNPKLRLPTPNRREAMQMLPYGGAVVMPSFYTAVRTEDASDEEEALFEASATMASPMPSSALTSPAAAEFQPLAPAVPAVPEGYHDAQRELMNPGRKLVKSVGRYRQFQLPQVLPQPA
mmetsp:Transcript_115553/g.222676  ORF Transcript_115553/g.222676 Transcript_115553/m.222676 type:complete len:358 (+) Transcript_115553:129-1202(+)